MLLTYSLIQDHQGILVHIFHHHHSLYSQQLIVAKDILECFPHHHLLYQHLVPLSCFRTQRLFYTDLPLNSKPLYEHHPLNVKKLLPEQRTPQEYFSLLEQIQYQMSYYSSDPLIEQLIFPQLFVLPFDIFVALIW